MLDGVQRLSAFLDPDPAIGREPSGLTQDEINALPSIMGPVADPNSDSTARVDSAGYVYLWEPGEDIGFWVQAGYVRNGRPRFGQVIDPNDIQWFNLALFKKKVLQAKKSLNAVRMPNADDIWDVANEADNRGARAQRRTEDGDVIGGVSHASDDPDIDIV